MNLRRAVLLITSLAVAGLLAWLAVAKWDSASKVATVVSALASVATVGVAAWAALPASARAWDISASRTGKAVARRSSQATTGVKAPAQAVDGTVRAEQTGDAAASDGSDATSGVKMD